MFLIGSPTFQVNIHSLSQLGYMGREQTLMEFSFVLSEYIYHVRKARGMYLTFLKYVLYCFSTVNR